MVNKERKLKLEDVLLTKAEKLEAYQSFEVEPIPIKVDRVAKLAQWKLLDSLEQNHSLLHDTAIQIAPGVWASGTECVPGCFVCQIKSENIEGVLERYRGYLSAEISKHTKILHKQNAELKVINSALAAIHGAKETEKAALQDIFATIKGAKEK